LDDRAGIKWISDHFLSTNTVDIKICNKVRDVKKKNDRWPINGNGIVKKNEIQTNLNHFFVALIHPKGFSDETVLFTADPVCFTFDSVLPPDHRIKKE